MWCPASLILRIAWIAERLHGVREWRGACAKPLPCRGTGRRCGIVAVQSAMRCADARDVILAVRGGSSGAGVLPGVLAVDGFLPPVHHCGLPAGRMAVCGSRCVYAAICEKPRRLREVIRWANIGATLPCSMDLRRRRIRLPHSIIQYEMQSLLQSTGQ